MTRKRIRSRFAPEVLVGSGRLLRRDVIKFVAGRNDPEIITISLLSRVPTPTRCAEHTETFSTRILFTVSFAYDSYPFRSSNRVVYRTVFDRPKILESCVLYCLNIYVYIIYYLFIIVHDDILAKHKSVRHRIMRKRKSRHNFSNWLQYNKIKSYWIFGIRFFIEKTWHTEREPIIKIRIIFRMIIQSKYPDSKTICTISNDFK